MVKLTANGKIITSDTISNAVGLAILAMAEVDPETMELIPAPLETVRAAVIDFVNDWAGSERRKHFTDITAQDSVYLDKEAEARRCLADAEPTAAGYPYCEIERGIIEAMMGQPVDLHTAAGFIIQVADEKRALSVAIEAKRRGVGAQVAAAQTIAEIEAALAGLE